MIKSTPAIHVSLTWFGLLMTCNSMALESDQYEPIQIQADAAMVDETAGTSVYRGEVIIEQGTLEVTADEVDIISADSEVIQITAKANPDSDAPARYRQQINPDGDQVTAEAKKITYLIQERRLHLSGNARLRQVDDVFTGELLYYDLDKGVVNLSAGNSSNRVNMTISPRKPEE
jgi:lipopolysaccharide export system protein LptA